MKRMFLLSAVLSASLFGFSLPFSLNTTANSMSTTQNEQTKGENNYHLTFSNGYVNTFKVEGQNTATSTIPWLNTNTSPFDAFDFDLDGFLRRRISTKIVNQNFWLVLARNPESGLVKPSSEGFDIYISVYDMNTNNVISNTLHFGDTTSPASFPNLFKGFKATRASKNARIGFLMCADYGYVTTSTNKIYTIYPYNDSNCSSGTIHSCDYEGKGYRLCYSSDNFAVRPKNFSLKNIPLLIKSGNEFNLTVDALDGSIANPAPTKDYNETLYTDDNTTVKVEYQISKAGLDNGNLSIVDNKSFKDGETNATFKYDNVGVLNITITEINGSEFAKVDENDTPPSMRFITPVSTTITVVPDHFKISGGLKNFNNSNFTYISDINKTDYNMSSDLELNITAMNKDNNITTNYSYSGYATPVEINMSYNDLPSQVKKMILVETNTSSEKNVTIPNPIEINISNEGFANPGKAQLDFKVNFDRNYSIPVNTFDFTLQDINVSDMNGTKGEVNNFNKTANFRYGRIDVQSVSGYGNELNTTYKYEYWTNEGWKLDTEHNSSFGDVNETNSYYQFLTMNIDNNINNGVEKVNISTTHALPYSAKIHLAIPSWLWYNPLAENYKAPSSTNQDCLTHPCESATFNKTSSGWSGIGKNNVKSSDTNRTVDVNASVKKIKSNKKEVNKINW